MSHEIESMMFSGETPWHGLGTKVEDNLRDVKVAIVQAGLDWEAEKVPLVTSDSHAEVPDVFGVRRKSDGRILGTVGARYTLLQNQKAFDWFQPFLDAGEACIHTAGSLRNGSRIWVLAKINREPMVIKGDDVVEKYMLLSHSHDGSLAIRLGMTGIRVVCANTLALSHHSSESKLIRIRHTASVHDNMERIRDVMNLANSEFEATAEQYRMLANRHINSNDLARYIKRVLEVENEPKLSTRMTNIIEKVMDYSENGKGNRENGVLGTYWTALAGMGEYLAYGAGRDNASRTNSLWFGENAKVNQRALEIAVQMAS